MSHEDFHAEKTNGEKLMLYFHYKGRSGGVKANL